MQEKMDFWDFLSDEKNWQIKAEEDAGLLAAKKKNAAGEERRGDKEVPVEKTGNSKSQGWGFSGAERILGTTTGHLRARRRPETGRGRPKNEDASIQHTRDVCERARE
mmetsp:Transcript_6922/g.12137  ORF Transcript_6922/g.12137 Transcript_6922/m.12137 type:complete len:108 (-) Transcript_6922:780-1103(-)